MKIVYSGNQAGLVKRKIKPIKLCFKRNLAEIQLALAEWMNASIIDRLF